MPGKSFIGTLTALCIIVALRVIPAGAHWDMEPRFWADDAKEQFFLRIHNGAHANRKATRKEMTVCFWIEGSVDKSYRQVSEKKCSEAVIEPDMWMDFVFKLKEAALYDEAKGVRGLKPGSYRAVAMAREQKGRLAKILFGAALERLYSYFEFK